jgi:RNA polymerase sigma factor (sigma-70 family)
MGHGCEQLNVFAFHKPDPQDGPEFFAALSVVGRFWKFSKNLSGAVAGVTLCFKKMEKPAPTDPELLNEWLGQHREAAFHALVARYAGLVYATAKRSCGGDDSLAAEASQLTFITLAQKAKSLTTCASLGGWLHATAAMQARNLLRKSQRESRKRHLLQAAMETESHRHHADSWQEMQPVLEGALAALSAKDREALILRFYRSLTVREIATTLGIATDAAQKRIDRATDRLRSKLACRGFQTSSSLSAAMLAGYAAEATAAPLSTSLLASKAITATAISTSTPLLITLAALMKSSSLIPPVLILIAATSWIVYQRQSISEVRSANATMEQTLVRVANQPRTVSVATDLGREKPTKAVQKVDSKSLQKADSIGGKQLIAKVAEMLGNRYDQKDPAWDFLKQQISSLSKEDLVAALDEVAAQNFHFLSRYFTNRDLLSALREIDPGLSLNRCGDLIINGDENLADNLTHTLKEWGKKDPQQAGAWLDQQIATGKYDSKRLDSKDCLRDMLEANLIDALLIKNNASAKVRLKSLSTEDRDAVALKLSAIYGHKAELVSLDSFSKQYGKQSSQLARDCYEILKGKNSEK